MFNRIRYAAVCSLCSFLFLSATPVRAQVTATLLGTVRDSSGAVLPHAKVTATNTETNLVEEGTTNNSGQYRILALPAGRYKVEAEVTGFQKFLEENVVLTVNEQHQLDVVMQVGNLQQQVQVEANAVQVETASTQMGNVISDKAMASLPLNGRSYIDLFSIQAGVAPLAPGSSSAPTGNYSVNGQRGSSNAFLVNGGNVNEGENFGTSIIPNLDSIAEFRLVTNSFDPQYGRYSGAVMNAITKSGTNGFHGTAFEFLRNSDMDSRSFFNVGVSVLKRNQFGYAIGGPAIKNRLFWFTDYQGTRQVQGSSSSITELPTPAQRAGQFSTADLSGTVSGPYWAQLLSQRLGYTVTNNEPYSQVFPGGVIPTSAMSPIALNYLQKYIPMPNQPGGGYLIPSQISPSNDDKAAQRVDFINKKTGNWYGYYHFDDNSTITPGTFGAQYGNFGSGTFGRAQQGVLSNTRVIGPTSVNEFRVDYMRNATHSSQPLDQPISSLSSLGFQEGVGTLGIISSTPYDSVPGISLLNFSAGRAQQQGQFRPENTYEIADNFSKTIGSHALMFGGSFLYMQVNERNTYDPSGWFNFDGSETGSDIADFLLGAPVQYIQASYQVLDSRTKYGAIFAQDSWRIKPNFTINYGVRWEVSMPWYDSQNKIETIVPGAQSTEFPNAPKGWLVPGDPLPGGGTVPSTLAPTTWDNFAPRLGLAWSPNYSEGILGKLFGGPGKTSIRASAGMFYTAVQDAGLFVEVADAPYGLYWNSISPPMFDQPFLTRADGTSQTQRFPFNLPVPGSAAAKNMDYSVFLPIAGSPGYLPSNKLPYAMDFNFSIQRQLSSNTVLTMAYVGTQGRKLFSSYEANPGSIPLCLSLRGSGVAPGTTQCGPGQEDTTFTRPDGSQVFGTRTILGPDFSSNTYEATAANSDFNSMQVSLERRGRNMTFLAAYTLSKSLDDASSFTTMDFLNFGLGRGLSTFDVTNNFVVSYSYTLPFYKFGSLPKRLTDGWTINGITRAASGLPVSLSESGDRSLTGAGGVDRPNYIGGLVVNNNVRNSANHQDFNKSAFTQEALGVPGNADPRFFHGPGQVNFDLGVQKTVPLHESMNLLIRAEFFNAFNHANFLNPSGNFSSSLFGVVTSAGPGRIGQVAMKFSW